MRTFSQVTTPKCLNRFIYLFSIYCAHSLGHFSSRFILYSSLDRPVCLSFVLPPPLVAAISTAVVKATL